MAAALAVATGAFVQGSVGFGLNLVAAPVLAVVDPSLVPGPALVLALVLTLLIGIRDRAGLDLRRVAWPLAGRVPGNVVGALVVALLPAAGVQVTFAVLVLAAVAMSAVGWRVRVTPGSMVTVGALSGAMGTATSIGGPPLALLYQDSTGVRLRGTLSPYFVLGATLSLATLALAGELGLAEVLAGLALVPALLAGFAASRLTAHRLDAGSLRPAVLTVAAGAALVVLVRALL